MQYLLGVSAFYHDSAVALLGDGRLLAAAQEERFTRERHDERFPALALQACLRHAGIDASALSYVAYYDKPLLTFERLLETYLSFSPRGFASFRRALPLWLREKIHLPRALRKGLGGTLPGTLVCCEHHESHAASAFYPSPFEEAAVLTVDGVGEWATTTVGEGRGNTLRLHSMLTFPHSLGLLYSAFTYYCGFRVNSGEYKLMGLAPYGEPRFADTIRRELLDLKPDGSFRLNMEYFTYATSLTMTGSRFDALFGAPRREPEAPLTQRIADLAASIQLVTEEALLALAREAHRRTGLRSLCMAGGVALNCTANGRLRREGPFERLWIQPAAGDAGGALGAALFTHHNLLEKPREPREEDSMEGAYQGPAVEDAEVREALRARGARARSYGTEEELLEATAALLAEGAVVGWFYGRMEFGPRALGARSILADPRRPEMQSVVNQKIKFREGFRPFAPSVLQERAHEYFDVPPGYESPYMLEVAQVHASQRLEPDAADPALEDFLQSRLRARRSTIPAVTHVDGSARVQTVSERRNGRYYRLLAAFARRTGCPVLLNSSLNVRGEPIACSPRDALEVFLHTAMDALVLQDALLVRSEQEPSLRAAPTSAQARFRPD